MRESVGLNSEHVIEDPGTRTRGAGALAMEDFDRSLLVDDRAGAVDSMCDKHTRFEEGGDGVMREERALVALRYYALGRQVRNKSGRGIFF
jgi:hypothetical protein